MAVALQSDRHPSLAPPGRRHGFLAELGDAPVFGYVGPNWYASVMGTGIVSIALVGLPFPVPGARPVAAACWLLAAGLLVLVSLATLTHHRRHAAVARGHLHDPVMAHFYGAPAMASMTVGAGALLVGRHLIGTGPAVALDAVLWTVGTTLGLLTAVAVPYLAFTRHDVGEDAAGGGWLMPVVPPMVSAATGALLVPHLPAGQARATLLVVCYLLFGLALVTSLVILTLIWQRLVRHGVGAAAALPTLWIVLGPLGQSITAAHQLGRLAPGILPTPYGAGFQALTLVYGLPAWGFAVLWLSLAAGVTLRALRAGGLPFSLTWWSFTFPVGTLVTGTSALASVTGLLMLQVAAGLLMALLLAAWSTVLVRTVHGVWVGRLLLAPARGV